MIQIPDWIMLFRYDPEGRKELTDYIRDYFYSRCGPSGGGNLINTYNDWVISLEEDERFKGDQWGMYQKELNERLNKEEKK